MFGLIMPLILFSSCYLQKPVSQMYSENNKDYTVDYLFEYEGCKVYRFKDMGNYVYFTNCAGEITSIKSDTTKQRITTVVRRK